METARRCGLVLDSRTLRRKEVEASCPFCHDHGPGKYHLSLNTDTDQYRCNLCGAHGNSVSLYARIKGIDNKASLSAEELAINRGLVQRNFLTP
ncbi:CHC2 zinc finger domain-containing protein [Dysosmobacter sp.]|uniref:CHC2 zinc finger domain-containing protein n=1 Tax=Dysosmobacter sp. TaxID=2591382 RepID=UPI003079FC61